MSRLPEFIHHICARTEWQAAQQEGEYRAVSLDTEGFIHFSRQEQVQNTANNYYSGVQDLVLLKVEVTKLSSELRSDPVGEDEFPHLYGPLNMDAVVEVEDFPPQPDGSFIYPQG